jgi:hypothetical protein
VGRQHHCARYAQHCHANAHWLNSNTKSDFYTDFYTKRYSNAHWPNSNTEPDFYTDFYTDRYADEYTDQHAVCDADADADSTGCTRDRTASADRVRAGDDCR